MTNKTEADPDAPAPDYEFHPIAELFPMIDDDELAKLAGDIRDNGMLYNITLHEGQILDGRNRYKAAKLAGVVLKNWRFTQLAEGKNPRAFVITANIRRRDLTIKQKRDLLAELIKADPTLSDRSIADIANASHHTVGAVRAGLEATGQVAQLETRKGADGKERKKRKRPTRTETEQAVADFKRHREAMVEAISRYADTTHAGEHVQEVKDRLDTAVKQLGDFFDDQNEKDAA